MTDVKRRAKIYRKLFWKSDGIMNSIISEINKLKEQKNAIILAHYYTSGEVQSIADYVGDSYYLAKVAKDTKADVVVFCGVAFMGESVKLLNPDKTVLMPDMTADCPMAHMVDIDKINQLRKQYDDLAVVCYINSTAQLKCYSDVCVTSSNAVKIVNDLPNENIFFIPDENLGRFVASKVPHKNIILNDGCCPVHAAVTDIQLAKMKLEHPDALVLTHPECRQSVVEMSDYVGSTADILKFAKNSDKKEFIICTENGIDYPLNLNNPDKKFYFVTDELCCADMKLNTLDKVLHVLKTGENEVVLDEMTMSKANAPLDRMLEMAGK